ncbi:hypothetical protein BAUCODRAFT_331117 [Baudoinia panamericana UAMH 10762]|uniref:Uncharacterized protein n=1 Tax=Baudoinia panamericana (strain UAMH 10762) TaxID=717646 RepID=M2M2Z6_BAUPA|nr:uncharacterized protein BAUCODRAFT_331117 [Baudoinia panamericana UAMH 10762]EMC90906.1 hypothetical protein BAUCODRAFT_331117 [Baudoinia panamericana UAMH 10762]
MAQLRSQDDKLTSLDQLHHEDPQRLRPVHHRTQRSLSDDTTFAYTLEDVTQLLTPFMRLERRWLPEEHEAFQRLWGQEHNASAIRSLPC